MHDLEEILKWADQRQKFHFPWKIIIPVFLLAFAAGAGLVAGIFSFIK